MAEVVSIPSVRIRAEELLRQIFTRPIVGVEIGVNRGQLSELLLGSCDRMHLFMVDPWRPDIYVRPDGKFSTMAQEQYELNMGAARERVRRFEGRATVLRMPSIEAAQAFHEGQIDFVFIDGDHSYESVKADIAAWWPKVVRGGIFGGHDYRDDKPEYGVKRAVNEFARGKELRLGKNHCWFVTR